MVARQAPIPFSASPSRTRSNHAKSNWPGRGSTLAQEKIPTLTRETLASRINRRSSTHTSSDHCSGL